MLLPFSGGCACGAIRYECSAEPLVGSNCHCRECQRASGSAFSANLIVPAAAFTVTRGEPTFYRVPGASGQLVSRGFCSACGSPLFARAAAFPDFVVIKVGSLDDPSEYRPSRDIYTESAQPWDYMNPELPKFAQDTSAVIERQETEN